MGETGVRHSAEQAPPPRLKRLGRGLVYLGLLALVLPKGAAFPIALLLACLPIGLAALIATALPSRNAALARSSSLCLMMLGFLAACLLFQAWHFPGNPLAHPIWADANRLLGTAGGAISVDPATTLRAVFTLAPPFLLYAATLSLFDSDRAALRLMKFLAIVGIGFAAFGLIQLGLFPDSLLFFEKRAYLEAVTSVFVNRNTSGTFLGIASLVVLSWLLLTVQEARTARPIQALLGGNPAVSGSLRLRALGLALAFAMTLLALSLTLSRGAVLSTLAAYVLVTPLLVVAGRASPQGAPRAGRLSDWRAWRGRRLLLAAGAVAAILLIGLMFGAQAMFRLERQSFDVGRLCAYAATWRGIQDHWVLGTGFGTFQNAFPGYRVAGCAGIHEVFERAHNFYLEGMFGLGIIFVPITLLTYGHVLSDLRKGWRARRRMRWAPILGLGAVLLVTLHGLVDFSLQIPGMAGYFAVYLGATTVLCLGRSATRVSPPPLRIAEPSTVPG